MRAAVAMLGVMLLWALAPRPAHADTGSDEERFVELINGVRAARGVAPVQVDGRLVDVARLWSGVMAAAGDISHNPNLRSALGGGPKVGENVGMGPGVATIEDAFENSPHHLANMVDPAYTHIGVGIVMSGGTMFVTEDYKQGGVTSAPSVAAAPRPTAVTTTRPPAAAVKASPTPAPNPVAKPVQKPVVAAVSSPAPAPAPAPVALALPKPVSVWQVATAAPMLPTARAAVTGPLLQLAAALLALLLVSRRAMAARQ